MSAWYDEARLDQLQAQYDRLTAHRGRVIRYFDQLPDGDRRKPEVMEQLDNLGTRIVVVEQLIDKCLEGLPEWNETETLAAPLTHDERLLVANTLHAWSEGVQENLDDDAAGRDHEEQMDGEPNHEGTWPVVEDYQNDADRIAIGQWPANDLTREVLREADGPAALVDDPQAFLVLVARLFAAEEVIT